MPRATAVLRSSENDQTSRPCAYLKPASNATFFEKRPYIEPARPKTTKTRTWTWVSAIR